MPSGKFGRWTSVRGDGTREAIEARNIVSSAPIAELLAGLSPAPLTLLHARELKYRDFLTVVLIGQAQRTWPDNWIYIHDPKVKVGRVQNFRSWSPEMIPDETSTCLGLEYFCCEDDVAVVDAGCRVDRACQAGDFADRLDGERGGR